jgi:hypothetical protein
VCGAHSDDTRVKSCIKQLLQVLGTIKQKGSSNANPSFFIQYLIVSEHWQLLSGAIILRNWEQAGICASMETHRKIVRDILSTLEGTRFWLIQASDFVPVLDHLWHGAAADGHPIMITWADYVYSRGVILPVSM